MAVYPNLDRLKQTLQTSGIQQSNPALFQVISALIDAIRQGNLATEEVADGNGGNINALLLQTYLTATDQTAVLINSRELLAGDNVVFDDSVAGERTIDVVIPPTESTDHVVLADGGDNPTLGVGDGGGGFIYTAYTP